jgi:hypothetical protein
MLKLLTEIIDWSQSLLSQTTGKSVLPDGRKTTAADL